MSQLNSLIPPEITGDALYELIEKLSATEVLNSVLEIGSSAGGGSTEAFVAGLSRNAGSPKLYCVEVSKVRFEQLRETYASYPFVHCYNRSSVTVDEFPEPDAVRLFYNRVASGLTKFPLDQVLSWLEQDISYVRDAGVEGDAIEAIKADHGIDTFDMVLIDGSEFTGEVEYEKVKGAHLILLDDTNTFKCWHVRERLMFDPMYDIIADDQTLRNGYSAFRRRQTPRDISGKLPIHFLTIVLNGEPFIRYHEQMLLKLQVPWHWHIVEGVAELKHDTAWSVAAGGRVADSLHDRGRSNDGTSTYLDDLATRFPNNVTVYRKPPNVFWDGKLEMVNAPIENMKDECLLWQMDNDELWTVDQIERVHAAFVADPQRTAAFYWCWYFVGPQKIITTRYNYAQNPQQEWLRTWRFVPGAKWAAHEPPTLIAPGHNNTEKAIDLGRSMPFTHDETEEMGAVFQHYAYATEDQLSFKEIYYGYKDARTQWRALQAHKGSGQLKDFFGWVNDKTMFDDASPYLIDPIARLAPSSEGNWDFEPEARLDEADVAATIKRPRIVVDAIFWQYLSSGIGRVWENLLREWVKSGFIDNVMVLDRGGTAPRIPGVHYWSMPRHSYERTGLDSLRIDEVCRRLNADLFVSTYYSSATTTSSFYVGYDMIPEVLGFPLTDEAWQEKRRAILHAAGHSMISQNSADDLEGLYPQLPRGSTYVTHVGVAPVFSQPHPDQIETFKSKHRLSQRPYVMMVGERIGFGGYKNGPLVFRALALMPQDEAPTLICVGGHEEIEAELRQLAPHIDVRRLSLDDEELVAAYSGAHALVYPSKYEGFGMPPVEAMACGAPAIVCHNSSLPEVVGDAALYVDEDDPKELVAAIQRLHDDDTRGKIRARGLKQAEKFTFEAMARNLARALVDTNVKIATKEIDRPGAGWVELRRLLAKQQEQRAESKRPEDKSVPKQHEESHQIRQAFGSQPSPAKLKRKRQLKKAREFARGLLRKMQQRWRH